MATNAATSPGAVRASLTVRSRRGTLSGACNRACMPSGAGRITTCPVDVHQPLMTAEFLAVDTETNGLAHERCELTEVGAVLVGGGELHERWASLVNVASPL